MTIVLFTEDGPTGEALSILARKILLAAGKRIKIKRRQLNRGDIFKNHRKLAASVELAHKREKSKIIVCVDSECTPPAVTAQNLKPCKDYLRKNKLVAHFIIAVHALESRLAADSKALQSTFSLEDEIKVPGNFETECRPADMLKNLLKRRSVEFIKSRDDIKIAEHTDPEMLTRKSSSFAQFRKVLLGK